MEINKKAISLYQASIQKANVQIKLFEEPNITYNNFTNVLEYKEYLIELEERALEAIDAESKISNIINYYSMNIYFQELINDTTIEGNIYHHPFLHIKDKNGNKIKREELNPNELKIISQFTYEQYRSVSRINTILSQANTTSLDTSPIPYKLNNIDILEIHKLFELAGIIPSSDENYTKSINSLCKTLNHKPINNPRTQLGQMLKREVPFKLLEKMNKKVKILLDEINSEN